MNITFGSGKQTRSSKRREFNGPSLRLSQNRKDHYRSEEIEMGFRRNSEREARYTAGTGTVRRSRHGWRSMADSQYPSLCRDARARNPFHHGRQRGDGSKP